MLQQREVVGNVEDDTDEELLKQVGNAIYAVLNGFNSFGSDGSIALPVLSSCIALHFSPPS